MIKNIKKHIEISSKRLQYNLTNIHYWPQNLYIINTYNGLSKSTGDIDYLFRRLSLIIWNKGDKSLRHFIRDISLTGDIKSFRNIKNNYHIFHKLIVRL